MRLAGAAFPKLPSALLEQVAGAVPRPRAHGRAHDHLQHLRQPRGVDPGGHVDGLPVGMQVLARHHADELLFDVALAVERNNPWPLVAPAQQVRAAT